jgi:hypothetical protein
VLNGGRLLDLRLTLAPHPLILSAGVSAYRGLRDRWDPRAPFNGSGCSSLSAVNHATSACIIGIPAAREIRSIPPASPPPPSPPSPRHPLALFIHHQFSISLFRSILLAVQHRFQPVQYFSMLNNTFFPCVNSIS